MKQVKQGNNGDWQFNAKLMARQITRRMKTEGLSSYKVSYELKVAPATVQRLARGGVPDLPTFLRACQWLGTKLDSYVVR